MLYASDSATTETEENHLDSSTKESLKNVESARDGAVEKHSQRYNQ